MRVPDDILARLCIAMREGREMDLHCGHATLMTRRAGGVWKQPMVVGYIVVYPHMMVRQWCRSVDELIRQMEPLDMAE